ncbi:sensor histidine kinase [Streptomyces harbinensis]|uniref:Signal transduction histidine-protein kinase/phosphatase MprB n=1 Tax=Streptomyces harbinensis TaxID=1176198 RepID=A0A1I6UAZ0_9ACTN|nr:HAMP domain-containing sensor histidine kinase [Streptomyces harbinensis]SFS98564.1 Signal transduction histidine kinase [Streptomyces harbinensis]
MRWALVRISLAVTSMVVLAFAVPLGLVVQEMAGDRAIGNAERQAAAIGPVLAITGDRDQLERAVASTEAGAAGRMAIWLPTADAPDPAGPADPADVADTADPGREALVIGDPHTSDEDFRAFTEFARAATLEVPGGVILLQPTAVSGERIAVVEVFVPDADLATGVTTAWLVLAGVGIALVAGSLVIADRLGRRTVRPAEQLAGAARRLGEGRLDVRVPEAGPAELREAAVAFNSMADQVVRLLANERELAADLSHRLRTPLTVLRLNTATLGEGDAADQTRHAVDQLEAEIDQIIRTVREQRSHSPESPGTGERGEVDAAEVIRERMAFWSALAEDEGREARLSGADAPVRVPVPRADLVAALDAMLGNVFRHTPEGTAFAVDVHHASTDDAVIVLVSDAGEGIADPDAALRRGHGHGGPGSTGLGLDIVRRLAESTGGDLRIGRSVLGGAEIRLWLARGGTATDGGPGRDPGPARRRAQARRRTRHQAPPSPLPGKRR